VKKGFSKLLNDKSGHITLGANTHELLIRFFSALPIKDKPRFVTTDGEFHSIRRQLDRLTEEGIEITLNEYPVPADVISSESNDVSSKQLDNLLCEIYKNNPNIAQFCELLLDLDEGFQEWRYRHVKMVERTIGTKTGTGGSDGVKYLVTTLSIKFFPVLWSIRKDFNK